MFVAEVDTETLERLANDASIEAEYQNYVFPEEDPPDARPVTAEEIAALKAATVVTSLKDTDFPGGGDMVQWPVNAVAIGQAIFRPNEAVNSTITSPIQLPAPTEQT